MPVSSASVFRSLASVLGLGALGDGRGVSLAKAVRAASLTYLTQDALSDLYELGREMERDGIGGLFVEAGCALGGSAIVLAASKHRDRQLRVYDVFGMIPPPSDADGPDVHQRYQTIRSGQSAGIAGNRYYGYESDLLSTVRGNFARFGLAVERHNVLLIKGLFQDTMRFEQPVALAHIDGDWYESVKTCLMRIGPRLARRGVMVIDDYDAWSGCQRAVDEFCASQPDRFELRRRARLQIVRR